MNKYNQYETNNFTIIVPYQYFIYCGILCFTTVFGMLSYMYLKLKASKDLIETIELKYDLLERLVKDLKVQNERLIGLIEDLKTKNNEFESLIQNLKVENDLLSQKFNNINTGTNTVSTKTSTITNIISDPFVIKSIIIFGSIGVVAIGGYFLTSFILEKVGSTSIGLFIQGVDSHLKFAMGKLGIFKQVEQFIFKDSVNRKYLVEISNNSNLSQIQIECQGKFVDIGSYISELLQSSVNSQVPAVINMVDASTNTMINSIIAPAPDSIITHAPDITSSIITHAPNITSSIIANAPDIENVKAVTEVLSNISLFS